MHAIPDQTLRLAVLWLLIALAQRVGTAIELAPERPAGAIRVATFNVSLNRPQAGQLTRDLSGHDDQAASVAAIIRAVRPDVLLLNEVDYSDEADNAGLFHDRYLLAEQPDLLGNGPHVMPYRFTAPVNTGVPSQLDLDRNGRTDDPEDAWGFGRFPGQYGMAVLSRLEIDQAASRTFQMLRWAQLPGALEPVIPETGENYYPAEIWRQLRLPSKSLWDVAIRLPDGVLHLLASHPTPPVFDGPEDRNGCRNHDEIRLLCEYIESRPLAPGLGDGQDYWRDDQGRSGSLPSGSLFVIAGDLNCDPVDGDSRPAALRRLLAHPRVQSAKIPHSHGAVEAAREQGGKNRDQTGEPAHDTADFNDFAVGNLRVDYVLPSAGFEIIGCGVVWPATYEVRADQLELRRQLMDASDHHLVWVDLKPSRSQAENR